MTNRYTDMILHEIRSAEETNKWELVSHLFFNSWRFSIPEEELQYLRSRLQMHMGRSAREDSSFWSAVYYPETTFMTYVHRRAYYDIRCDILSYVCQKRDLQDGWYTTYHDIVLSLDPVQWIYKNRPPLDLLRDEHTHPEFLFWIAAQFSCICEGWHPNTRPPLNLFVEISPLIYEQLGKIACAPNAIEAQKLKSEAAFKIIEEYHSCLSVQWRPS